MLLGEIKQAAHELTGGKRAVYIEGGRTIKITDVLQLDHRNVAQYDRLESALAHYLSKRTESLADRVFDALIVLDKKDAKLKAEHSDAVESWRVGGYVGECPQRVKPPLENLFELFCEIFPQIRLSYSTSARQLTAHKGDASYGPSGMSDGEKQVFSILADLLELDDDHTLVIADEPELNLHPELAERLWTLLENEFPDKHFVYATHNISFALRPNVDKVWVLSANSENITEFTGLDTLPRADVVAFLGAIPGILSAHDVLVTEGHEKSFDAIFYRWLLDNSKIEIFPAGSCTDVTAVIKKVGLWSKISTTIALRGVIDSDYRGDSFLSNLTADGVVALDLHEAESYLCVPEIICAVAQRIASQEEILDQEGVTNIIFNELEREKMSIAARRLFARSQISVGVSLDRTALAGVSDADALAHRLREACASELERASRALDADNIVTELAKEIAEIVDVSESRDVMKALRILPGKELANKLAPRAGCKNASDLMRSVTRNFKAGDFYATATLSAALRAP
ncbi:AAA family ATPase [Luteimonas fraxinea]|uniref:AAA family ATPase n=1 Tax=Luteimonas fraxinea TaxID=2901869 RepID=UPI001E3F0FD5|nr:AAA family ATPase [Luteimonas fraxinea]MCD9124933.1 ATP-binding protein [Luteimonas fraxinea]